MLLSLFYYMSCLECLNNRNSKKIGKTKWNVCVCVRYVKQSILKDKIFIIELLYLILKLNA